MEHYGFDVFWSEEDSGYIATCPDFPGLSAFGESEEQALIEGKAALRLFLELLQTEGKRAPRATTLQNFRRPVVRSSARRMASGMS
jgi:predicted RNase H-like HicB family nuclease